MPQPRARLFALVVPVCAAGGVLVAAAAYAFVAGSPSTTELIGVASLLVASMLTERFPVPIEGLDAGGVSLGIVFGIAAMILFGWDAGVIVAFGAPLVMQLAEHRPPLRVGYNAAVYALAAGAAGMLVDQIDGGTPGELVAQVGISFSVQYVVNLLLVSAALAASTQKPFARIMQRGVRWTIVPFALMASAALMLVVLWQRAPFLSAALVGPLLAIALYQRSTHRALQAMRLALTDPLTGLGNHRHFHERLQAELSRADDGADRLTLCLIDVDDFKRINDRYGHPVGDRVLAQLATGFRSGGETFRLGGDEFAILLPAEGERQALGTIGAIVERVEALEFDHGIGVTISAGIATFPEHGSSRDDLVRLADSALYWAKERGKNRVHVYRPTVVELAELRRLASGPDDAARFRAAASLAKAVDARDVYTGSHSERVADLSARIAARLGLSPEQVEFARLAGSLHDLGKLAIPEDILRKAAPLSDSERLVLERHPQIGFRMLESLGVDPVAQWVLHHHERWDGSGYPDGLNGQRIPLGARILFVADAWDAMTSDRVYRDRLDDGEALAELERCAGSQFDPEIVSALAEELGLVPDDAAALAS